MNDEVPIISCEAGMLVIMLMSVGVAVIISYVIKCDCGGVLSRHWMKRMSFSDVLKQKRFYVYLCLLLLLIMGPWLWFCLHLNKWHYAVLRMLLYHDGADGPGRIDETWHRRWWEWQSHIYVQFESMPRCVFIGRWQCTAHRKSIILIDFVFCD